MRRASASPISAFQHLPLLAVLCVAFVLILEQQADLPTVLWCGSPLILLCRAGWRGFAIVLTLLWSQIYSQYEQGLADRWPLAQHGEIHEFRGEVSDVQIRSGVSRFVFHSDAGRKFRLSWYRDAPTLEEGACWQLKIKARAPRGSANPGGFDYEAWLFRKGLHGTGYVREGRPCVQARATESVNHLADWRGQKAAVWELEAYEPKIIASLQTLSLGLRDGLDDQAWDVLRKSGTSHLFAISGLHLGLIAGLGFALGFLIEFLSRGRVSARAAGAVLAVALATFYAAVSGWGLPVQRAWLMLIFMIAAEFYGRGQFRWHSLALAALLMIILDARQVASAAFVMSFAAVTCIFGYLHWRGRVSTWRAVLEIQLLLSLLLCPFSLLFFGGASLVAPLANLLLVPLFSLYLPLLLLASMTEHILLLQLSAELMTVFWAVLEGLTQAPWAFVSWPSIGFAQLTVLFLALVGLLLPRALVLRVPSLICLIALALHRPDTPEYGEYQLWFWDVGQGSSMLIRTAEHSLLYDTGPAFSGGFDAGASLVVPALREIGIASLDAVVVSHGDLDHRGGLDAVMSSMKPNSLLGESGEPCIQGNSWQWDGVRFEFLHPATGDNWSDNNGSCVLRVSNEKFSALLTGDIEQAVEQKLVQQLGTSLAVDVLSVPHHGSSSSSSAAFLKAVRPKFAVASAGYANRWNFPTEQVQQRYAQANVSLLNTADHGSIMFDSENPEQAVLWRHDRAKLWRYSRQKRHFEAQE